VVIRIQELLLPVSIAGDRELDLTHKSSVYLSIDHDVPSTHSESIFDSDNFKLVSIILALMNKIIHDPYYLFLIRVNFASQEIEKFKGDEVDRIQVLSCL
jgi:hypothetical protein